MIPYFQGVRVGLGDPVDFYGYTQGDYKLKWMYVDLVNDYVFFYSKKKDMTFHNYLCQFILDWTFDWGIPIVYPDGKKLNVPDITIKGVHFEVESGLKHSLKPLIRRLQKYSEFTYVVVPNDAVKQRYRGVFRVNLKSFHGRLMTIGELEVHLLGK